jgi:lipopolysaccharide export system protein LptA
MQYYSILAALLLCVSATKAQAQEKLSSDAPIEIASDALEVLQNERKAIFTGNVIATQGNINMRADAMTVLYRETSDAAPTPAAEPTMGKGIYRIESTGKVVFTTPTETAQGDTAIYLVDDDTIELVGNVFLTRDKNILKGTKLVYNLTTSRSVLTGGVSTTGGGRVRGLFVPGEKPAAGATP